jgi:Glycosyltransferase like family 2
MAGMMGTTGLLMRCVQLGSFGSLLLSAHSFLNTLLVRRPHAPEKGGPASPSFLVLTDTVTVCIPARNEAANIGACLDAVLANRDVEGLRVLVLDDGSTDQTRAQTLAVATVDARVKLIEGGDAELPSGWLGKTWACQRLLTNVETSVVIYVDADVRLHSHALEASVAMLREHRLSLLSPYPQQLVGSWPERFTQPLLQWLWMTFLPLGLAEGITPVSMAAANGQFMVLDTEALRGIGGFATVKGEVLDDVALARSLKRSGFRAIVAEGSTLATCRMYQGWAELRDGYTKNLWSATGSLFGAAAIITLFFGLYLLPVVGFVVGLVQGAGLLILFSVGGYLAGVLGRGVSARSTGGSVIDAVFHPASIAVLIWLIIRSWKQHLRGSITWKGRTL